MAKDSPVHVTTQRRHYVGKDGVERVYETNLLRRSFREDGKVRNETVANPLPPAGRGDHRGPRGIGRQGSGGRRGAGHDRPVGAARASRRGVGHRAATRAARAVGTRRADAAWFLANAAVSALTARLFTALG